MTDRDVMVRDMIVHRCMDRNGLPSGQEQTVERRYSRFRRQNQSAFDYLEELAVNLGNPEFVKRLDRLTNEFCEWLKNPIVE